MDLFKHQVVNTMNPIMVLLELAYEIKHWLIASENFFGHGLEARFSGNDAKSDTNGNKK